MKLKRLSKTADPNKRGIKIIYRLKHQVKDDSVDASSTVGNSFGLNPVNLDLMNVPLLKVIEFLCVQQNLKYKVEEHAVIIADKSVQLDEMEVSFYHLPSTLINLIKATSAKGNTDGKDNDINTSFKMYLKDFGVKFSSGSQLEFIASVNRLIIKNTSMEHSKIETFLKYVNKNKPESN